MSRSRVLTYDLSPKANLASSSYILNTMLGQGWILESSDRLMEAVGSSGS